MPGRSTVCLVAAISIISMACTERAYLVEPERAGTLVLQPSDLPRQLVLFDEGPLSDTGMPLGSRSSPRLEGGWVARYRHSDPGATRGILVLESSASVYANEEAAARALVSGRQDWEGRADADISELVRPGIEEGWMVTFAQPALRNPVRFFLVSWTHGNVGASVLVQAFEGAVGEEQVLALVSRQQRRIAAASAG